ncbi:MAG: hypothetical protein IKO96_04340 [Spirochaetales bacterium]|nr:hypothetical protein [Spirochaetales bacterium]
MRKRFLILAVLLFCLMAEVFAATYTIRSYTFNVKGKTTDSALSEFVGEPGETFGTLEELEAHVADKRQQLYNKRIFHEVGFSYTLEDMGGDVFMADVVIYIDDARTFIILPFPKYDSNYGFEFKVKAMDSNFLGTFATLEANVSLSQRDNSFKQGALDWDLGIGSLKLKNGTLSLLTEGAFFFSNWVSSNASLKASISDVKFGKLGLNGSISFKLGPDGDEKTSGWSLQSITTSLGESYDFERIALSNSTSFTMVPDEENEFRLLPYSITDTVGLTFKHPTLSSPSFSTTLTYYFWSEVFDTSTTFTNRLDNLYDITATTSFATSQTGFENGLDSFTPGFGISRGFALFNKISFTPSIMFYLPYYMASAVLVPYMVTTLPFSYGAINWQENNFRKGFVFSLTGSDTYYFFPKTHALSASGNARFHYPVTSWFNPSARLDFKWANSLQAINYEDSYSEKLRGIRNDNEDINKERKFGMILNMDLLFNFIRINDFCSTYAVPFMDIFVGSNDDDGLDTLVTIGGEGIIVLDNYPSFPIRGSLGFNAKDLFNWMRGEIGLTDVEFELFIGLHYFY